jgi:phosphate-selective porin OprO and OprP
MRRQIITMLFLLLVAGGGKAYSQGCAPTKSDEGVGVFGFLQPQYTTKFENETKGSFNFERVRIGVNGNIPYDFSYYVVLELSPFIANNPYLLDAFISYSRFKWAKVSLGSFKTPFGLETNTACNGLMTIMRSTATLQTVAPFRDIGLMFMGGDASTRVQYQLGLMNGSGLGRLDNNKKKDVVGRFLVRPFDFVQLGASFRHGYPSYNNNEDTRTSIGAELQLKYKNFTLLTEYIMDEGDYNRDLGGGCSGNLIELGEKRNGGYATLAYRTPWNLEPVFRYDFYSSGNKQNYEESNMTFGLNYFFNDWTRFQLNYIYRSEPAGEQKNDALILQMQITF